MLSITETMKLETKDELMSKLKEHVAVRDQMGGSLYWNIMNDECCAIATRCAELSCDRVEIGNVLGKGNFR